MCCLLTRICCCSRSRGQGRGWEGQCRGEEMRGQTKVQRGGAATGLAGSGLLSSDLLSPLPAPPRVLQGAEWDGFPGNSDGSRQLLSSHPC